MSRIILHIGTHKTATTTLQQSLHANRGILEKHGIIYPHTPPSTGHHILAADWIEPILPPGFDFTMPEGGPAKMWKDIADAHSRSDRTVFISAEAFSRGAPKRMDMKSFRQLVERFDQIEVVCVLRDQLSYLQSVYMQLLKNRVPQAFSAFYNESLASGMAAGIWLDFGGLYDHILTGFPPGEIRFMNFNDLKSHPDGVVGAMLDLIPGAPPPSALSEVNGGQSNVSPDPLGGWTACRISAPRRANPKLIAKTTQILKAEFGESCRTMLYTAAEVERLIAHFTPMNDEFERRVQRVQPDFKLSAFCPRDSDVGRDRLNEKFWIQLCREFYRDLGSSSEPG